MKSKKLILKKEKVASLSNQEMGSIMGGTGELAIADAGDGKPKSTEHNFLCGWCTQVTKGNSCLIIQGICA